MQSTWGRRAVKHSTAVARAVGRLRGPYSPRPGFETLLPLSPGVSAPRRKSAFSRRVRNPLAEQHKEAAGRDSEQLRPDCADQQQRQQSRGQQRQARALTAQGAAVGLAAAATGPLVVPGAALASATEALHTPALMQLHYHYHQVDDHTMTVVCIAILSTFSALTFAATCRFLMSFYPGLEKRARQGHGPLAFRAVVALDGVLEPMQRSFFRVAESDEQCNYAAMALLASMSMVLEVLFGRNGLLLHSLADWDLLGGLNYLIFFQQMLLLPQWCMAVFRRFGII